jgi:hypothetical protein
MLPKAKERARPTTPVTLGPQPEDPLMAKEDPEPRHQRRTLTRGMHQPQVEVVHGATRHTATTSSPGHLPTGPTPPDDPTLKPEGLVAKASQGEKATRTRHSPR